MTTREEWLTKAKDFIIEQVYKPHEIRFSPIIRVSVGPCPGKAVGVCCDPNFADDGAINIFITPEHGNNDAMEVLSTLTHELVHAANFSNGYDDAGHGYEFKKIAKLVGLEGRPKSCGAKDGTELYATLSGILASLGDYPHMPLRKKEKKTRVSQILTFVSLNDPEFEVKCKFSTFQEKGAPKDPEGISMEPKDKDKLQELEALVQQENSDELT